MQKKPVIIIAVHCVISLGLGYWYGLPKFCCFTHSKHSSLRKS